MDRRLESFSTHRLGGEPLPGDLATLVTHADEFAERTGIELNGTEGWAPWSDTSYLTAADCAKPDIAANVRAVAEVCGLIAFVAANEDGEYLGYWRGTGKRPIADSPLVRLDNEGQFGFCGGTTFAEAVLCLTYGEERFAELRDWMQSLGIAVQAESSNELAHPDSEPLPDKLHKELYTQYRREAGTLNHKLHPTGGAFVSRSDLVALRSGEYAARKQEGAMIELTEQQAQVVEASGVVPTRVTNPRNQETFVLLRVEEHERLKADDYDDSPWTREEMEALAWEAGKSIGWEEMDEYDRLPEKS